MTTPVCSVSFVMTSPHVTTVLRPLRKRPALPRRGRSIREISRRYFRIETMWMLIAEMLIFGILGTIVIWPLLNAVAAMRLLL